MSNFEKKRESYIHEPNTLQAHAQNLKRKNDEQELLIGTLRMFQSVVEASPEAIAIHDAKGRFIYCNPSYEKLFGCALSETAPQNYRDCFPPQSIEILNREQLSAHARGESWEGELDAQNANGQIFPVWVHAAVVRDTNGNPLYGFHILHDVTERRRVEDALRNNLSIQEALLSTIPALVYLKDKNFRYMAVNKPLSEVTGIPVEEMKGKWDYDFFPRDDADKYHRDDRKVIETNQPIMNIEETIQTADGRILWVSTCKTPLRDQQGRAVGVVGITLDISEKKRFEEHINQAQKMEAVGQLAGGIAHNINNLLTGIIGNLSIAQMKVPDSLSLYIKRAQEASYRASDLVNALLAFSRKTELDLQSIPVNPIVSEVCDLARQTIDRRIDMELDLTDGLPNVRADAAQMNTVLMNLCINARDAINKILEGDAFPERSGDRFVITLKTDMKTIESNKDLKTGRADRSRYVVLSVTDNGIGIDEDTQKRIFEPFYTTKNTVGTGLGLASAFGSIKQHNGWIDFQSEYGVGTTFSIYLPEIVEREAVGVGNTILESGETLKGNESILIIDDEEMILHLGQEILEEFGYRVILARDGEEGMQAYERERERLDLILLDLSMPKLSGQELLKQVRQRDSRIKIVISSGYAESVDIPSLMELGANGVISKPYYPQNLLREIRKFLDVR